VERNCGGPPPPSLPILSHSVTAAAGSKPARAASSMPIWSASDSLSRLFGSWIAVTAAICIRPAVLSRAPSAMAAMEVPMLVL
jgi:hypothetical protein